MRPKKQTLLFGMASIWADSTAKMPEKCSRVSVAGVSRRIALLSLLAINEVMKRGELRKLPGIATRRWRLAGRVTMTVMSLLKETRLDLQLNYLRRVFAGVGATVLPGRGHPPGMKLRAEDLPLPMVGEPECDL